MCRVLRHRVFGFIITQPSVKWLGNFPRWKVLQGSSSSCLFIFYIITLSLVESGKLTCHGFSIWPFLQRTRIALRESFRSCSTNSLPIDLATNEPVKARFSPWLEPLSVRTSFDPLKLFPHRSTAVGCQAVASRIPRLVCVVCFRAKWEQLATFEDVCLEAQVIIWP